MVGLEKQVSELVGTIEREIETEIEESKERVVNGDGYSGEKGGSVQIRQCPHSFPFSSIHFFFFPVIFMLIMVPIGVKALKTFLVYKFFKVFIWES